MKIERNPTRTQDVLALIALAREIGYLQAAVAGKLDLAIQPECELRSDDVVAIRSKLLELVGTTEALGVEMLKHEKRQPVARIKVHPLRPVSDEGVSSGVEMATEAVESMVEMQRRLA